MFGSKSPRGYQEVLKGIKVKTLSYGENMLMTEFLLAKGSMLPEHAHANEQTGYLVKGKMKLTIDGKSKVINPGDCWNIGGNIKHKAEILEDSVAVEVFNPMREDYLKYVCEEDVA